MDSSEIQGIDLLPPEILSQVFSFLHIGDRKKVRLVCKEWDALASRPAIIKNEKFVFRVGYSLESIDIFLRNCERVRSTIEFQGFSLERLPRKSTWRRIGDQIHSLSLFECVMSKNIFLYCPNMHTYTLTSPSYSTKLGVSETLDELIQLNIVRQKMTSFQLLFRRSRLPNDVLHKILKIFPRIRTFGIGHPSQACLPFKEIIIDSPRDTFDPSLIKELTFNLPSAHVWLQEFMNVSRVKLEKLEAMIRVDSTVRFSRFDEFMKLLRDQSELRTLKISLIQNDELHYKSHEIHRMVRRCPENDRRRIYAAKVILFESLPICPKLVNFCLECSWVSLNMYELFKILRMVSTSKLESFILRRGWLRDADDVALDHDLTNSLMTSHTNKSLQTLNLEIVPEKYCLPIFTHFCNLRHLELHKVSDKVLQTIFQYHIHLCTLILHGICDCTAFGFTGRKVHSSDPEEITYSISRLSELTHLELRGTGKLAECINSTLREFNFPRLKLLRLSVCILEDEEISIDCLPTAIPHIEVLILFGVKVSRDPLLEVCKHLHRLKALYYTLFVHSNFTDQLFAVQPSLTYILDATTSIFYNRITKDISNVGSEMLRFVESVPISRLYIRLP